MTQDQTPNWTEMWVLSTDMINCSECHAAQFMPEREADFVHSPDCSRYGSGQRPYMELLQMLEKMQGAGRETQKQQSDDDFTGE